MRIGVKTVRFNPFGLIFGRRLEKIDIGENRGGRDYRLEYDTGLEMLVVDVIRGDLDGRQTVIPRENLSLMEFIEPIKGGKQRPVNAK